MKHTNLKRFIFFVFGIIIFLPLIVDEIHHPQWMVLDGAYNIPAPPVFNRENWMNGIYQKDFENNKETKFSLRPLFVRLRNQLYLNLWGEVNVNDQLMGKNRLLFSIVGMRRYLGMDCLGRDEVKKRVLNIKTMRDKLEQKHIKFVLVIDPSRQYFYRDYFPEPYASTPVKMNDYALFKEQLNENNIDFLDLTVFFDKIRNSAKYPLYSNTGFHWTTYGAELATDTFIKYIEERTHTKLPGREWQGVDVTDTPRKPDDDIGLAMNLLWNIKEPMLAYPNIKIINNGEKKPNVLVMGDSYFNNMFDRGIFGNIFSDSSTFWYYNMTVRSKFHEDRKTQSYNLDTELKKRDIVIFMINNTNFNGFPFDFDKRILELP